MITPGLVHLGAAAIALTTGLLLFASRKGTVRHRRLGFLYLAAMVNLNVGCVDRRHRRGIGPFHMLTIVSLATLVGAYLVVLLGRPGRGRSEAHGTMMAWSYAGACQRRCPRASARLLPRWPFPSGCRSAIPAPDRRVGTCGHALLEVRRPRFR